MIDGAEGALAACATALMVIALAPAEANNWTPAVTNPGVAWVASLPMVLGDHALLPNWFVL